MPLQLEIVTPVAKVYEDTIDSVVVPTSTGEIGILPGHIPVMTEVQAGEITVEKGGHSASLAVSKGFAQVIGDKVSILAEDAIDIAEIDTSEVEAAQKRAEASLRDTSKMSDEEIEMLETTIQYAKAQLLIKQKRR